MRTQAIISKFLNQYSCSYIKDLYDYLVSFVKRTQPLIDIEGQLNAASSEFDKKWEAKELSEWENHTDSKPSVNGEAAGIWCAACMHFTCF